MFSILPIFIFSIVLFLGLTVFLNNYKNRVNQTFLFLTIFAAEWIVANFAVDYTLDLKLGIIFSKLSIIGPVLLAPIILYFSQIFPLKEKKNSFLKLFFIFIPSFVFIILSPTSLNVKRVFLESWGVNFEPGVLYFFLIPYLLIYFIMAFKELFISYRKNKGIEKLQVKYILSGILLALFVGMITNAILPVLGYSKLVSIGPSLSIAIFSIFTAYAITRYRFMDIRIVARRIFIYFGVAVFVYGIFFLVSWFFHYFFGGIFTIKSYLAGLLIAPIFTILFYSVDQLLKIIANKYFFVSLYNYQATINKLADELNHYIDLDKIVNLIVDTIKRTMCLDRAGVLLVNTKVVPIHYQIAKVIGFNKQNGISLVQNNFLTEYLEKNQKPLVRDELITLSRNAVNQSDKNNFYMLYEHMKKIEASICLPVASGKKLIGIIVLGGKVSNDIYTKEDLTLLDTFSKQAAIAIENARLYKEVQEFNRTLQQRVDEQTKEIREQKDKIEKAFEVEKQAHELEKKALEDLRHLDASKTDFMLITQHHLRTPLSVNAGFIDLILTGSFGKIPAKLKGVISRLQESTQKEIDVVNELLDVSSYQIGKEAIHLDKQIDFESLMQETLKDLTAEAKAKGIYLKYEKKGEIPKIPADRLKLKLVLTNVIDNCIKYTAEGGVTVTTEVKNEKLLISVTDTGIGLSDEIMRNLFKQTFHRGEQAKRLFAVGKGLGLFLSGKVIEGHHGRIWAESRGEGKGSVFFIELPIKQETKQSIKVEDDISADTNKHG